YQNTIYSATNIPHTSNAPTAKPLSTENNVRSTSSPFTGTPRCRSQRLIAHIPNTHKPNTMLIRSRNGISYSPSSFSLENPIGSRTLQSTQYGENFSNTDNTNPPTVANKAALEVVPFQKKPRMNMAKIPGD